jgi:hypothetical protein
MHAASVNNKDDSDDSNLVKVFDDDQDDGSLSFKKRAADYNNDFPDEYQGIMLGRRRFASRGVRLPSESILLGKRRLPVEAVLLGRRDLPNEGILLGKRR